MSGHQFETESIGSFRFCSCDPLVQSLGETRSKYRVLVDIIQSQAENLFRVDSRSYSSMNYQGIKILFHQHALLFDATDGIHSKASYRELRSIFRLKNLSFQDPDQSRIDSVFRNITFDASPQETITTTYA